MEHKNKGALAGIRVIDIGTMVAGPVAATLLADYGAEVIKIEQPGRGDALRHIGPSLEGESLWWNVEGRNKKSVTLDLHHPEGQRVLKELLKSADVLVENFRPGILDKWNLSWKYLQKVNPRLVMLSVSGYGQTGPYSSRAGYDRIALAMGGTLNATGYADRAPVKLGTAMADYSTAVLGALGTMVALHHRDANGGTGQQIDLSLYETVFRFTDVMVTAYEKLGITRERTGNIHFAAAPGDHFETCDGRYIVLTVSNDRMFGRLCEAIPVLAGDERFSTHAKRITGIEAVNKIVADWIKSLPVLEVCKIFEEKGLAYSLIYSIEDIVADPHYQARGSIATVEHPQIGALKMSAVQPQFSGTPSPQIRPAPALGAHTDEVLRGIAGLSVGQIAELRKAGTV
ncbi:CoA transferase [Bradyrhizobium sp. 190]|nr:CoA transferase [Bradyrhizobium sp. 190]